MRGLRKCISRKDPKGVGGQAQQNNPGKHICDKIALKKKKTRSQVHTKEIFTIIGVLRPDIIISRDSIIQIAFDTK